MQHIRIGNAAGFWGDSRLAPIELARAGRLDYLTLEYLAELTMSILAHLKSRDPEAGYVSDFPDVVRELLPVLHEQPNLGIITNAGGMNPEACARKVAEALAENGLGSSIVASVSGDDLLPTLDDNVAGGEPFAHFETGEPLGDVRSRIVSANAYLGSDGIVAALAKGARIVVTGRVADASLTVSPAVHEFGWEPTDWSRIAAATVAGHLIECGAQSTGGMYSDWTPAISLADVGYPIAEIAADGSCVVTKPEGSGGAVTTGTVAEQLVYEIGDPAHYLTPDVDADFSHVRLEQEGPDRVRVAGARGNPRPERYKVSMAYRDGYMAAGTLVIAGRDAANTARRCGEIVLERVRRAGLLPERTHVEVLGAGDSLPGVSLSIPGDLSAGVATEQGGGSWEVVLRIAAHDASREKVERVLREMVPLVTSGPPGVTGYAGSRPKPHPVLAYWPTTIARDRAVPKVTARTAEEWTQ
ncbi:MAG: acyclic terpene utilization AtuA family protein [Planctomycetaceae bacterium]